ncbi:MAG: hypothetical protein ACD_48C00636G0001, partial [uncultured bacterium]
MLKEKIARIQTLLKKQHIDFLVIGNFGHQVRDDLLYYLLLTHLELGIMMIPQKGMPTLYAIPFEVAQIKKAYPELRVLPFEKPLKDVLKVYEKKQIGYRPSSMPSAYVEKRMIALTGEERIFAIKLPEEITRLKKATTLTDNIFTDVISHWKEFKTEQDVATYIILKTIERGAEPSFSPIVASGKHASNPHHTPAKTTLTKGFCVIDMGVRYQGYCSDMTRTVYIGKPTNKEKDIYNHLLHAQHTAITACMIGTKISDIAEECRTHLGEEWNKHFTHALGHGLGTQVHEWPRVSTIVQEQLQENMYITIEPGVYPPGKFGMRIEDDVLITKKGPVVLTKSSKEL